jgi:hypothetical protein
MKDHQGESLEEQNAHLKAFVDAQNNKGLDDFDGLSAGQMQGFVCGEFGENGITVNPNAFDGNDIPMIAQINYFLGVIGDKGVVKLTQVGNLPPAIVRDVYAQGFLTDDLIEWGMRKLTTEMDADSVVLTRILCEASGLIKMRNNTLSLTEKGKRERNSPELVGHVFDIFCHKFNWAYFDGYKNKTTGQSCCNYSLYLVDKYGDQYRDETEYEALYFKAFPFNDDRTASPYSRSAYCTRTFARFLKRWGFIEYEDKDKDAGNIRKTELFDKYIKIELANG